MGTPWTCGEARNLICIIVHEGLAFGTVEAVAKHPLIRALQYPCTEQGKAAAKLVCLMAHYKTAFERGLTWELLLLGAGHSTFSKQEALFPGDCEFPACMQCQLHGKGSTCGTNTDVTGCWRLKQDGSETNCWIPVEEVKEYLQRARDASSGAIGAWNNFSKVCRRAFLGTPRNTPPSLVWAATLDAPESEAQKTVGDVAENLIFPLNIEVLDQLQKDFNDSMREECQANQERVESQALKQEFAADVLVVQVRGKDVSFASRNGSPITLTFNEVEGLAQRCFGPTGAAEQSAGQLLAYRGSVMQAWGQEPLRPDAPASRDPVPQHGNVLVSQTVAVAGVQAINPRLGTREMHASAPFALSNPSLQSGPGPKAAAIANAVGSATRGLPDTGAASGLVSTTLTQAPVHPKPGQDAAVHSVPQNPGASSMGLPLPCTRAQTEQADLPSRIAPHGSLFGAGPSTPSGRPTSDPGADAQCQRGDPQLGLPAPATSALLPSQVTPQNPPGWAGAHGEARPPLRPADEVPDAIVLSDDDEDDANRSAPTQPPVAPSDGLPPSGSPAACQAQPSRRASSLMDPLQRGPADAAATSCGAALRPRPLQSGGAQRVDIVAGGCTGGWDPQGTVGSSAPSSHQAGYVSSHLPSYPQQLWSLGAPSHGAGQQPSSRGVPSHGGGQNPSQAFPPGPPRPAGIPANLVSAVPQAGQQGFGERPPPSSQGIAGSTTLGPPRSAGAGLAMQPGATQPQAAPPHHSGAPLQSTPAHHFGAQPQATPAHHSGAQVLHASSRQLDLSWPAARNPGGATQTPYTQYASAPQVGGSFTWPVTANQSNAPASNGLPSLQTARPTTAPTGYGGAPWRLPMQTAGSMQSAQSTPVTYSTPSMPANYSVQSTPANYSVQPTPANYSIQPTLPSHSTQPAPASYSAQPVPATRFTQSTPASYSAQASPAAHSVQFAPANYSAYAASSAARDQSAQIQQQRNTWEGYPTQGLTSASHWSTERPASGVVGQSYAGAPQASWAPQGPSSGAARQTSWQPQGMQTAQQFGTGPRPGPNEPPNLMRDMLTAWCSGTLPQQGMGMGTDQRHQQPYSAAEGPSRLASALNSYGGFSTAGAAGHALPQNTLSYPAASPHGADPGAVRHLMQQQFAELCASTPGAMQQLGQQMLQALYEAGWNPQHGGVPQPPMGDQSRAPPQLQQLLHLYKARAQQSASAPSAPTTLDGLLHQMQAHLQQAGFTGASAHHVVSAQQQQQQPYQGYEAPSPQATAVPAAASYPSTGQLFASLMQMFKDRIPGLNFATEPGPAAGSQQTAGNLGGPNAPGYPGSIWQASRTYSGPQEGSCASKAPEPEQPEVGNPGLVVDLTLEETPPESPRISSREVAGLTSYQPVANRGAEDRQTSCPAGGAVRQTSTGSMDSLRARAPQGSNASGVSVWPPPGEGRNASSGVAGLSAPQDSYASEGSMKDPLQQGSHAAADCEMVPAPHQSNALESAKGPSPQSQLMESPGHEQQRGGWMQDDRGHARGSEEPPRQRPAKRAWLEVRLEAPKKLRRGLAPHRGFVGTDDDGEEQDDELRPAPQRQVDKHPMRGSSAHVAGIRGRVGGLHRPVALRQAPDLSILSREQDSPRGWGNPMMRSSLECARVQEHPLARRQWQGAPHRSSGDVSSEDHDHEMRGPCHACGASFSEWFRGPAALRVLCSTCWHSYCTARRTGADFSRMPASQAREIIRPREQLPAAHNWAMDWERHAPSGISAHASPSKAGRGRTPLRAAPLASGGLPSPRQQQQPRSQGLPLPIGRRSAGPPHSYEPQAAPSKPFSPNRGSQHLPSVTQTAVAHVATRYPSRLPMSPRGPSLPIARTAGPSGAQVPQFPRTGSIRDLMRQRPSPHVFNLNPAPQNPAGALPRTRGRPPGSVGAAGVKLQSAAGNKPQSAAAGQPVPTRGRPRRPSRAIFGCKISSPPSTRVGLDRPRPSPFGRNGMVYHGVPKSFQFRGASTGRRSIQRGRLPSKASPSPSKAREVRVPTALIGVKKGAKVRVGLPQATRVAAAVRHTSKVVHVMVTDIIKRVIAKNQPTLEQGAAPMEITEGQEHAGVKASAELQGPGSPQGPTQDCTAMMVSLLQSPKRGLQSRSPKSGFQISKLWESTGLCQKYGGIPPPKVVFALFQTDVQQALLRAAASQKRGQVPLRRPVSRSPQQQRVGPQPPPSNAGFPRKLTAGTTVISSRKASKPVALTATLKAGTDGRKPLSPPLAPHSEVGALSLVAQPSKSSLTSAETGDPAVIQIDALSSGPLLMGQKEGPPLAACLPEHPPGDPASLLPPANPLSDMAVKSAIC